MASRRVGLLSESKDRSVAGLKIVGAAVGAKGFSGAGERPRMTKSWP